MSPAAVPAFLLLVMVVCSCGSSPGNSSLPPGAGVQSGTETSGKNRSGSTKKPLPGAGTPGAPVTSSPAASSPVTSSIEENLRQARSHAEKQEWREAEALVAEALRQDSRNGEALLLQARIMLDRGLFQQAQAPLDTYASIDSANRQYLFLRARREAEGLRNREGAVNLLWPLVRQAPDDPEPAVYLASLLLESSRQGDNDEGRRILARFLGPSAGPDVLSLAARDSIGRENWREAKIYLDRLLARRKNPADMLNAWKVERALGNNAAALSYARELYNRDSADDNAVNAFIASLVDTGRRTDAAKIIEERLAAVPGGPRKSRYYYLRSRIRSGDDAVMNDLRSALFEDPQNMDALIAMFEMYHRRKDERRAVYYLRQALAIAPDNPLLKRYAVEYKALLGN